MYTYIMYLYMQLQTTVHTIFVPISNIFFTILQIWSSFVSLCYWFINFIVSCVTHFTVHFIFTINIVFLCNKALCSFVLHSCALSLFTIIVFYYTCYTHIVIVIFLTFLIYFHYAVQWTQYYYLLQCVFIYHFIFIFLHFLLHLCIKLYNVYYCCSAFFFHVICVTSVSYYTPKRVAIIATAFCVHAPVVTLLSVFGQSKWNRARYLKL